MYFLILLLLAFFIIFLFSTNWPVKLYHHYLLKKLGTVLQCEPRTHGMLLAGIYSGIQTVYRGREVTIRFVEGSVGALKSRSGLEIRLKAETPVVMGIYQPGCHHGEWGDFKLFRTGEEAVDRYWYILTNHLPAVSEFWEKSNWGGLLTANRDYLEQLQIDRSELIARLKRFDSPARIQTFLDQLSGSLG